MNRSVHLTGGGGRIMAGRLDRMWREQVTTARLHNPAHFLKTTPEQTESGRKIWFAGAISMYALAMSADSQEEFWELMGEVGEELRAVVSANEGDLGRINAEAARRARDN
jgi:hypothetical protein